MPEIQSAAIGNSIFGQVTKSQHKKRKKIHVYSSNASQQVDIKGFKKVLSPREFNISKPDPLHIKTSANQPELVIHEIRSEIEVFGRATPKDSFNGKTKILEACEAIKEDLNIPRRDSLVLKHDSKEVSMNNQTLKRDADHGKKDFTTSKTKLDELTHEEGLKIPTIEEEAHNRELEASASPTKSMDSRILLDEHNTIEVHDLSPPEATDFDDYDVILVDEAQVIQESYSRETSVEVDDSQEEIVPLTSSQFSSSKVATNNAQFSFSQQTHYRSSQVKTQTESFESQLNNFNFQAEDLAIHTSQPQEQESQLTSNSCSSPPFVRSLLDELNGTVDYEQSTASIDFEYESYNLTTLQDQQYQDEEQHNSQHNKEPVRRNKQIEEHEQLGDVAAKSEPFLKRGDKGLALPVITGANSSNQYAYDDIGRGEKKTLAQKKEEKKAIQASKREESKKKREEKKRKNKNDLENRMENQTEIAKETETVIEGQTQQVSEVQALQLEEPRFETSGELPQDPLSQPLKRTPQLQSPIRRESLQNKELANAQQSVGSKTLTKNTLHTKNKSLADLCANTNIRRRVGLSKRYKVDPLHRNIKKESMSGVLRDKKR